MDDGDLYQIQCKWSKRTANLIVHNSRKHHQDLDIPTPFDKWAPTIGQECRVFGTINTHFQDPSERTDQQDIADFKVYRDNPDGMWLFAPITSQHTGWTHHSSFAGLGTW
eukprot:8152739-Heterocapsa_arctica.AAC.1